MARRIAQVTGNYELNFTADLASDKNFHRLKDGVFVQSRKMSFLRKGHERNSLLEGVPGSLHIVRKSLLERLFPGRRRRPSQ